ncbi:MAG: hypothetical protein ACE5IC_06245 [Candidatus Brocadiales bacterium]
MPQQTINLELIPYEGETVYGNFTRLSRADLDVLIDIGVYDVHEVAESSRELKKGEIKELPQFKAKIVQRIALSASTFLKFRKQVEEIYEAYAKTGLVEKLEK